MKQMLIHGNRILFRRVLPVFFLVILFVFCSACKTGRKYPDDHSKCRDRISYPLYDPASDLGKLFRDVQLAGISPDSKTFSDCQALFPPDTILSWYNNQKEQDNFNLRSFVGHCFRCFVDSSPENIPAGRNIESHLHFHWDYLTREDLYDSLISSHISLVYPYVVPGGRFREMYYWDSYFTMEGLAVSGRMDLVEDMLNNFACLIELFGHIPNGNRSYYLSRSQPPFFAEMIQLYIREKGDSAGLKYLNALIREYDFWMSSGGGDIGKRTVKVQNTILNRYWDDKSAPRAEAYKEDFLLAEDLSEKEKQMLYRNIRAACESGWDFSSRWFRDGQSLETIHTSEILPVDLNCLMYNMEMTLSKLYALKNHGDSTEWYLKQATERKELLNEIFWSDDQNFYFDYDFVQHKTTEIPTLAAVFPLYFRIATTHQAEKVSEWLEKEFLQPGGLVTTFNTTGEQWDAPNGWPPLQWIAICGLENYGYHELAGKIANRWLKLNKQVYRNTGKMMEKYNVVDLSLTAGGGEYPLQDGFGWTNGVYLALIKKGYSSE